MSRRIAVIGAGQAGLQLALGLITEGFDVRLVTDRSGGEILDGRVLSTQCMFDTALQTERDLGANLWEDDCPQIHGIRYSVARPDGTLAVQFGGRLGAYAQSVDQRLKMPGWMDLFEQRGGTIDYRPVDLAFAEELAAQHDLVVIASGKGDFARELATIFPRVDAESPYDRPQRQLAVAYVVDMEPLDPPSYFSISIVQRVGEYFVGPALTKSGRCWTMCLEAIPGGPMDVFAETPLEDLDGWLGLCKQVLAEFMPWEAERCERIRLTDGKGTLKGALTPVVRERVGRLPSGRLVLGVGDAVVLNDPLVGQGANNAAKGTTEVTREFVERGDGPYDESWLRQVGEVYWERVRWSTRFTNMMLTPPPHVGAVFEAGSRSPAFADMFAEGTNEPALLFPWLETPEGVAERAQAIA
ncbi:MAG TPA: styrene monooxygenase/indole monooxygenase family protein [Gaiellaceae bacterium]|nr:styrene monooxygenase/indole monooxygenase family protein [Gaiellaceae bacterium]